MILAGNAMNKPNIKKCVAPAFVLCYTGGTIINDCFAFLLKPTPGDPAKANSKIFHQYSKT
jgi:hypothetical protein